MLAGGFEMAGFAAHRTSLPPILPPVALGRNTHRACAKSARSAEAPQPGRRGSWTRSPRAHRGTDSQEDPMTAPFIFIGTHKIKPGKREAFKQYFAQFSSDVVEPAEPRLHSFYGYTAPDSDYVTIVQVHPDADSMKNDETRPRGSSGKVRHTALSPNARLGGLCRASADLGAGARPGGRVGSDAQLLAGTAPSWIIIPSRSRQSPMIRVTSARIWRDTRKRARSRYPALHGFMPMWLGWVWLLTMAMRCVPGSGSG